MMRRTAFYILLLVTTSAANLSIGCAQTPFPPNSPRTPYTRYQILRGEDRPAKEPGPGGTETVNLRNRLKPLGEP